jgi:UDP-GlcNAc:undecaprenyl-phosphate GlcNAc-1-phosphate transferase
VALIVAFAATLVATPLAARLAWRLDIVDRPGPLKVQSRPVPYLGGVAVFDGLSAPVLWSRPSLLLPLCLATVLGLVDDKADIHSGARLVAELVIGVLVAVVTGLPVALVVVGVLATVLLINAVNLLDGLDGLASGTCLVSAAGFAFVVGGEYRTIAVALAGALAAFLLWNRPPAHIYLGDAGSYLIGTALSILVAATLGDLGSVSAAASAALLVGVPVADTCIALVRRWRAKRPLFAGDRAHVYDQLVDLGWSQGMATAGCIAAQIALAALAVGVSHLPDVAAVAVTSTTIAVVGMWALSRFTTPASSAR